MPEKDINPRERFRNDPDPRKRFADVFINGEPVVSEPLRLPDDEGVTGADGHPKKLEPGEALRNWPLAHPMKDEDRLPEGEIQVIFVGRRVKRTRRS